MYDINQKLEIVKKGLTEGWSIQYSMSLAKIHPNSEEYHFVYEKLIDLINEYKRSKIDQKRHKG